MMTSRASAGERLVGYIAWGFRQKGLYGLHGSDANGLPGQAVPLATGRRRMISVIGGYTANRGLSWPSGHRRRPRRAVGRTW